MLWLTHSKAAIIRDRRVARDIGPTFVLQDEALIAIDWQFNGQAKYPV